MSLSGFPRRSSDRTSIGPVAAAAILMAAAITVASAGAAEAPFDPRGGLLSMNSGTPNTLAAVDPATGEVRAVEAYPGFSGLNGHSTIDVEGHRFFFPLEGRIFSVDSRTGAVLANPSLSENPGAMNAWAYDPDSGDVLAVMFLDSANHLVSIDPATGTVSAVEDYPGFIGINALTAVDPEGQRYFFAMAQRIFTVNSQTGAVITNPELSESPGSMIGWEYDPIGDRLLTVMIVVATGNITFMSIDPATGTVSPVKEYPGLSSLRGGLTALDAFNGHFFFASDDRMFALDTRSGAILANPVIDGGMGSLTGLVFAPSLLDFFNAD